MQELVAQWGYLGVVVGTFVGGETVLLAAGAIASKGLLSLPLVTLAAFAGSFAWGQFWYQTGRAFGRPFIGRRPVWRERARQGEERIGRYGDLFVIGSRFVAGMGLVAPLLLGAGRFPARRFVPLDVLGAAAWAAIIAGAGFGLGTGLSGLLGRSARWPELVVGAAMLGALFWCARRLPRRAG